MSFLMNHSTSTCVSCTVSYRPIGCSLFAPRRNSPASCRTFVTHLIDRKSVDSAVHGKCVFSAIPPPNCVGRRHFFYVWTERFLQSTWSSDANISTSVVSSRRHVSFVCLPGALCYGWYFSSLYLVFRLLQLTNNRLSLFNGLIRILFALNGAYRASVYLGYPYLRRLCVFDITFM